MNNQDEIIQTLHRRILEVVRERNLAQAALRDQCSHCDSSKQKTLERIADLASISSSAPRYQMARALDNIYTLAKGGKI